MKLVGRDPDQWQFLQENRRVSRSSLDHFTEYEQQTLFDLKGRAYTVSGLEEGKESEEREGGEDKMIISTSDAAECQPTKEPTPSDNTSGNSTPRQRRKRRSAAERRESHRRRSSAVVKDAVHLAKVLNGLPQQKQKHENDKSLDPCLVHCQPFSPIPDYSETENDEANLHEPPEPSVHAPGDEDEVDEEFDFISRLNGETAEKFYGRRTEANLDKNALLQNSLEHRRSISADHLLHGIGLRREMLLLDTDQAEFADAIQIKMRSPSPHAVPVDDNTIGQQRHIEVEKVAGEEEWGKKGGRDLPDASHLAKRTAAVSLRPHLLTQIEKQRHLCNDNGRPSICSSFTPSAEVRCAFHPNGHPMKGVSIAEVAGSLSGPEQSFHIGTSRWEKEMNRRTEKDKKRESKANSALLGTIWSIRPRRKKEGNRSLANLFCQQSDSKFGKEEKSNDDSGPLDVHLSDSPKKLTLAQSPSSAAFSFEQIPDFVSMLSPAIFSRSQLNDPLWDDLNIWEEEETSWAAKFPTESLKLENGERKRQNIIYELMMTEKNHCQVLVLLRQVYQEGLIRNGILDKGTVRKLVPEVLDTLLDFHLNLLRRFRILSSGEAVVPDISDVICEVFVDSQIRSAVIHSYTTFCLAREHSHALFAALLAQKAIVRKFFEFHESEHKDRSFKDCMLLVAQRLTKYPILIEQILKYESLSDQKLKMQKAHFAVKSFASEINDELLRHERKIQWEAVKKALEKGSTGKLIDPKAKQDFTYADLVEPIEEAFAENEWGRKVHLVQRVFWRETMTSPDVELRLLLCDDIIVFLRPKGTSIGTSGATGGMGGVGMERKEFPLQFFRHNSHSGVIPLFNTLVKGENLRRKSLLLIVTDKEQPDLIQLAFPTSPEMEQCVHAIKQAKTNAPKFVRLSKRRIFELSQRSIGEGTSVAEKEYQTKMDNWQRELEKIFAAYSEDSLLANYFECRMTFFDSVRSHLCRCPMRTLLPCEEQQQKQRITEREKERLSALLKTKFDELARKRNGALANLVERAQKARDADLPSFFDDLYDLGAAGDTPSQSSSGSDDQFNQIVGSSDSCENQTKIAEGGGKKKPRRVRTYHGHGSAEQKSLSGSSASSTGGVHPIRRHTTVPAGGHHVESSEEEDGEMDNEIRKLPQKMNPISRKAATEIIRDNVRLRSQNDRLKKESALKDLQLVSLRSRKSPSGETPERLESLRQKQEELQAEKKAFLTECKRREEEFRAKCAGRETKLRTMEDELRERADEFARMRAELEKLKREREAAVERSAKYQPKEAEDDPQTVRTPPTKATTNSPMRISNTYCGAGPIPRPSADLPQQRQQNCSGAECSFRSQMPQLAERRAISQMELPRHLVVKTETKQADKVRKMRKN